MSDEPLDLDAIRAQNAERRRIRDAATAGPWRVENNPLREELWGVVTKLFPVEPGITRCLDRKENAAFIAHARTDDAPETIDRLLEEVERLRYEYRRRYECKVCCAVPDEDGCIEHGRGCYTQSEDGGGTSYVNVEYPT